MTLVDLGWIIFLILMVIALIGFAISAYHAPFQEGFQKQQQGDWASAQIAYTRMLKRRPGYWQARLNRAMVALKQWQFENAIHDLDQLIVDKPHLARAYTVRGDAHMGRKELEQAAEDYSHVLSLKETPKEKSLASFKRGLIWLFQHNDCQPDDPRREILLEKAESDFDEALRLDPQNVLPYAGKAGLALLKDDQETASAFYNQALVINPSSPWILTDRSSLSIQQGRLDDAIADTTKAISLNSAFALAYNNRGYAYSLQEDYDLALADCNRALTLQPNLVNAFGSRGHTYFLMERIDDALVDFHHANEVEPKHKFAVAGQAICLFRLGRIDEARAQWHALIALDAEYTDATKLKREYHCADTFVEEARKVASLEK